VPEVLGHNEDPAWLLLADAGRRLADHGNPPEVWLAVLPRYAELQQGEAVHTSEHLKHGVPDLRMAALPGRYDDLLRRDLPLSSGEIERLRGFAGPFARLCADLADHDVPETIQHDDLHMNNVHVHGDRLRVLDWGDSCVSHPFTSLLVTFRFLTERNGLRPDDPWFARLRDAYLEPWGQGLRDTFALALRVGWFAHAIAWVRQRDHLPEEARPDFDKPFATVLRYALARIDR
jgi:hypothetical protein